ncbi:MAG: DEAD/DEAH box helicase, partial [Candidatus Omnitrophica bacterium]|nr:DEAD/DEAH box helicase [Candidatus Omnitrophota bacterium]
MDILRPAGLKEDEERQEGLPRLLEEPMITQQDISEMGVAIENHLRTQEMDEGLRQIVRQQAKGFIRKLEEKYFFREYYQEFSEDYLGENAHLMLEMTMEQEKGSITREVLGEMLKEAQEALAYQPQLRALGVKTPMNLYQLMTMKRVLDLHGIMLADEMGLGKTLQALASFLLSNKEEMLVLAPKAVMGRWMEDMHKHLEVPLELVIIGDLSVPGYLRNKPNVVVQRYIHSRDGFSYMTHARPASERKRVILMNYELLPHLLGYRKDNQSPPLRTDFLVLDEAHLLKNRLTDTAKAVYGDLEGQGCMEAEYKMIMTGTPLENRPRDIFAPLQYLARGGTSEEEVLFSHLDARRFTTLFGKEQLDRLSLLYSYISSRMVRRLKGDVLTGLPLKEEVIAHLDPVHGLMRINGQEIQLPGDYRRQVSIYEKASSMPDEFDRQYVRWTDEEELAEEKEQDLDDDDQRKARSVQLIRMEQTALDPGLFEKGADSIKFDALEELIARRVGEGKSVVVFSNYRQPLQNVRGRLAALVGNERLAYVDGTVLNAQRQNEINRFQRKDAHVMMATIATLGLGVELTQADCIIFLNYPWKPSTFKQAVDRAHRRDDERNRPGKKLEIISLEFDTPQSIDTEKAKVLNLKNILAEMIIEGNLTREVLEAFYSIDKSLIEKLKESTENVVSMTNYELSLLQEMRLLIGQVAMARDPEERRELWNQIAELYTRVVEHKASFFANLANLDYLSGEGFPEFKRGKIKVLDIASGPSTLYRAYERNRPYFMTRGLDVDMT